MSSHMTLHRHSEIRTYFSHLFANHSVRETDPWWAVIVGVHGFNEKRKAVVASSSQKTCDKSMSAFHPRTTPTGKSSTSH